MKMQSGLIEPDTKATNNNSTANESVSTDALIDVVFPAFERNSHNYDYITSKAILSTKNENVDIITDKLIAQFLVSGLPQHKLRLKKGCPIMLLQNIDPANGLCNGTRMVCRSFDDNVIDAEITVGQHAGKRVFLPRIPLTPSKDEQFPFRFKRKQFPVRLSFAMTINKSQDQTIPNVGIYLPESVFSHGQLYAALSRGVSQSTTKILVKLERKFNSHGVYTSNVVYREVLNDV
ncbi:ATP-dependent DNA helicase PIF1-like protein [Tanacetum coccineum]